MILAVCANPSVDSFWSINNIEQGMINRSDGETYYPGGKGIHVALALKKMESRVTTLGVWGGQTGKWIQKKCLQKDVSVIGPEVDQWTRICITAKSSTDWNETELLGNGPHIKADEAEEFFEIYRQFIENKQPDAVTISGSIPKGFGDNIYTKLITTASRSNIPAFLDASGNLLQGSLQTTPYCVHINQHEGRELCGTDDPVEIARWLADYCSIAAVTAGEDGLYLNSNNEFLHAWHRLEHSQIINTVGSGDCLLAGLCKALLENENPVYWAKFAVACGTANCVHPELGMLSIDDVKTIFEKVKLERIKI